MTIKTSYEIQVRSIALSIIHSDHPETTFSMVVMDDIKSRTEKVVVKKLIHEYKNTIEANALFNFDNRLNEKVLEILNNRFKIIYQ